MITVLFKANPRIIPIMYRLLLTTLTIDEFSNRTLKILISQLERDYFNSICLNPISFQKYGPKPEDIHTYSFNVMSFSIFTIPNFVTSFDQQLYGGDQNRTGLD